MGIESHCSYTITSTCGISQGSNLGHLLFLIYINDLSTILLVGSYFAYVDVLKIFTVVKDTSYCQCLQEMHDLFEDRCSRNRLKLCPVKCQTISFTRAYHPIRHNYVISNTSLTCTTSLRDLGVLLDWKLKFHKHLESVISRDYNPGVIMYNV